MEATLNECHERLAHERYKRCPEQDETRHWFEAEVELVNTHAYFRREKFANGEIADGQNWIVAQKAVQWRETAEKSFSDCRVKGISRPFLALAAGRQSEAVISHLERIYELPPSAVAFVTTLDGAPEHAQYLSERHYGNGVPWVKIVRSKNGTFYEYCRHTLATNRAKIVECGAARTCREIVAEDRAFEDGCIGVLEPNSSNQETSHACSAILGALYLRSYLSEQNYLRQLPWQEQLHPRIALASSWKMAIRGLQLSHRDEIVVEDSVFSHLDTLARQTMLACGIRLTTSLVD